MLSKRSWRQCPKIVVQNKEASTAPCSLALGPVAAETRGRVAARQASGSIPWIGVEDPSEAQRLQADHAVRLQETANFRLGPEKITRGMRCPKEEAWRTCGTG